MAEKLAKPVCNTSKGEYAFKIGDSYYIGRLTVGARIEVRDYFGEKSLAELENKIQAGEIDFFEYVPIFILSALRHGPHEEFKDMKPSEFLDMLVFDDFPDYAEQIVDCQNLAAMGKKQERLEKKMEMLQKQIKPSGQKSKPNKT